MYFNLKKTSVCLFIILTLCLTANASRITVKNQSDFDRLSLAINELLASGKDVDVLIRKGVYYYSDTHLLLENINKSGLSVRIKGNGAVLVPKAGRDNEITPYLAVIRNLQDVNLWSNIYSSTEKVAVVDANKKLCRIKRGERNNVKEGDYILLTKWYTSGLYKINNVDHDYIYFTAPNTRYRDNYGDYDVNFDYVYNKSYPRYKLLIADEVTDDSYVCSLSSFLSITNSRLSKVELCGLTFVGGSGQESVIKSDGVKADVIKLDNCHFKALRNKAIAGIGTNNIAIDKCTFSNCYSSVVSTDENCSNLVVKNCEWKECGQLLENPSCIIASGANYLIKDNSFVDFYGRALTLGVYFSKGNSFHSSGVVENNELYFTSSFLGNAPQNLLMDNGAIYVNTLNDHLEIRNNYIHDFSGAGDNRGIFLDDGARNVKITSNVIVSILNGAAISARRVKSVEKTVGNVNVGNLIHGNVIEGTIRFEGSESDDNRCEYGENYFLVKPQEEAPKNMLKNVNVVGENIVLTYMGQNSSKVGIDGKSYKKLKKSPVWKQVRKRVVRKNR